MFVQRSTQMLIAAIWLMFGAVGLCNAQHSPEALAIGEVAPEIEGTDVDGVKFKLSDYRGKVVVIDFWGDW